MPATLNESKTGDVEPGQVQPSAIRSSWLLTLLKASLSVLAIGVLAYTADLSAAWKLLANQNLWPAAAAAGFIFVQILLGGLRWHVILRRLEAQASVLDSLRLFYIAAFFNVCLWGAVAGDIVRGWLMYRADVRTATAITSVILDRVVSVAAVALLVLVTAPMFTERAGYAFSVSVASVGAAGLAGILIGAQLHRLPLDWQRSRLLRGVATLSRATGMIFLQPATTFLALGVAVTAQVALAIATFLLAMSLDIGLSFFDCLVLMQPVVLITALPISIGGWGAREATMVGLLGLVGVPASAAFVLSVQVGILTTLVALPGGVLWLLLKERPQRFGGQDG
jgi:uncharacterized membrane protein YbhN (UPF0104 family)